MLKLKATDKIAPYTYLLKFLVKGEVKYYYGVRYGNVKQNSKPSTDLFVNYFTSSTIVHNLLEQGCFPFEAIVHKTFEDENQACSYEVKFLKRIDAKNRHDFLNQVDHFDNSLPKNRGRVHSLEHRKRLSEISKINQSDEKYREARRKHMKQLWSTPEFKEKMQMHNQLFWQSEEGQRILQNRQKNPTFKGKKHSDNTKQLMSKRAQQIGQDKEFCKKRGRKTLYTCPICTSCGKLNGGNFNRHVLKYHNWTKQAAEEFKKQNTSPVPHQVLHSPEESQSGLHCHS
jgi:hypothetical protein